MSFLDRVHDLPTLGVGLSTEYGAGDAPGVLDPAVLRASHPRCAGFLEVGVEAAKGLDDHALAWAAKGWPTTYHFLDLNLDEPEDFDAGWLAETRALTERLKPAWKIGRAHV